MARGFSARGDVAIDRLGDGTDTARLWATLKELQDEINGRRDTFGSLLSYKITTPTEQVLQATAGSDFEEATEYGQPVGQRQVLDSLTLGFRFAWKDLANRTTWQFLADATRAQIDAAANAAVEADSRNVFRQVAGALFNDAQRVNKEGNIVYPLYSGDGTVPPEYDGETFAGTHSHFLTSGSAALESGDVDRLVATVAEHGFGVDTSRGRMLLFMHRDQADVMRSWRVATGAKFDFIASELAPAYLTTETLVGDKPPSTFGAVPIIGSYGGAWISESSLIPRGYVLAVVSNGPNSPYNPVGMREHPTTSLRGLRLVKGPIPDYPLNDSFWVRGMGTGIRLRGAAAVMQVTAGAYVVPSAFSGI